MESHRAEEAALEETQAHGGNGQQTVAAEGHGTAVSTAGDMKLEDP